MKRRNWTKTTLVVRRWPVRDATTERGKLRSYGTGDTIERECYTTYGAVALARRAGTDPRRVRGVHYGRNRFLDVVFQVKPCRHGGGMLADSRRVSDGNYCSGLRRHVY